MTNSYPVAFFVFMRPKNTRIFLDLMRLAKVSKVYIFADGPRNSQEKIVTDQVKLLINEYKNEYPQFKINSFYRTNNVGLKINIIEGLNYVFAHEESSIVIEDDCLPTPEFFKFTSELLTKYKDVNQVLSINGTSTGGNFKYSYDFTKYSQCWGWATWARSWKLYDPHLTNFSDKSWFKLSNNLKFKLLSHWYWKTMLKLVQVGWVNTWDYQWSYTHFSSGGLAIAPSINLIQNIGFDAVATNTKVKTSVADLPTGRITFPLSHPPIIQENFVISKKIERSFYTNPVAVLGLLRQYIYWIMDHYVNRH